MYSLEQNRWLVAELGCYLNVQLDTDRDPSQCIPSGDFGLVKLMSWKSVDQRKSGNPTDARMLGLFPVLLMFVHPIVKKPILVEKRRKSKLVTL